MSGRAAKRAKRASKNGTKGRGRVIPPSPAVPGGTQASELPGVQPGAIGQQAAKMYLLPELIRTSLMQYLDSKPHSEVRTFIDVLMNLREATPAERGSAVVVKE